MRSYRYRKKEKNNNSRINAVMTVVFLLGALTIYKLYDIQVKKHDLYKDMASVQHQISSKLEPMRGEILLNDGLDGLGRYPIATNKDFALVYVVPKDVIRSMQKPIAEKLYTVFNKQEVEDAAEKNVEEEYQNRLKKEMDFIASLNLEEEVRLQKEDEAKRKHEALLYDTEYLEFRKIKKEAEIREKREEIEQGYLEKLGKNNDPYEPIKKKVDEEKLKELYALLLSTETKIVDKDTLDIKNGKIIKKETEEIVEITGVSHSMSTYRFYPEKNIGSHILGFVSNGDERKGSYGLEGFFDEELTGQYGSLKTEKGAGGSMIIVNDREYIPAVNGSDLLLTINRSVQFAVCNKLNEAAQRHGADGGSVIVIDPLTGAIIAMCSWPDFDPNNYDEVENISVYNNPAIFGSYEPGSIFKTITMAGAIDGGGVLPSTTYKDNGQIMIDGWHKPIKNSDFSTHGGHGIVDMNVVLSESLNTGSIFAMRQIGSESFIDYVKMFGFGEKTGIELATEAPNNINNLLTDRVPEIYTATASFGQGITTTPLQVAMAYAAIANQGILMKPYLVQEIQHPDGTKDITNPRQIRRVISEKAATLVSGMLVNVVEGGHAKLAEVKGYYVGGKTGTAQVASSNARGYGSKTMHTFVGYAPIDDPKFVMLVKLDDPKDVAYSASSAAPLFGEIAEFLLQYYQVPKSRRVVD